MVEQWFHKINRTERKNICIVKYSYGTTSITLPLKYIKSIGTSEYSPVSDLGFKYVDDDLYIGGADAAISNVKIISLY